LEHSANKTDLFYSLIINEIILSSTFGFNNFEKVESLVDEMFADYLKGKHHGGMIGYFGDYF